MYQTHSAPTSLHIGKPPVPGVVTAFVRFVFNAPRWSHVVAACAVVLIVVLFAWLLWATRKSSAQWLTTRSRGIKLALVTLVLLLTAGFVWAGSITWHYTQHDNTFCNGCHVMNTAYQRFYTTKHAQLECHSCHQQSLYASMRQVVLWTANRPEKIPPHAKVPNERCVSCHVNSKSSWKQIANTAGHRFHLDSKAPALSNLQCVKCHGVSVHEFVPADKTCGQSGCHANVRIKLGKMAGNTDLHCTVCHEFLRPVNVAGARPAPGLLPRREQCLGCHAMQKVLAGQNLQHEPHGGSCGTCHDPHRQSTPAQAVQSCTASGCHANAEKITPMHRGLHAGVLASCTTCHAAHTWKAVATQCLDCHKDIYTKSARPHAVKGTWPAHLPAIEAGALPTDPAALRLLQQPPMVFTHARHKALSCTTCHDNSVQHGTPKVRTRADCQNCHHGPTQKTPCMSCHNKEQLDKPVRVSGAAQMSVWKASQTGEAGFDHGRHGNIVCTSCHTDGAQLAARFTCASCHEQHHAAGRNCAGCHTTTKTAVHDRQAHLGCGGSSCHRDAAIASLKGTRNVCLVCHRTQVAHEPGAECATCHVIPAPFGREAA